MNPQGYYVILMTLAILSSAHCSTTTQSPKSSSIPAVVYTAETARKLHGAAPSPARPTPAEDPDNLGFVDDIDFSKFKRDFENGRDHFPSFFSSGSSAKSDDYSDLIEKDPYGPLTSSASNQNSRKDTSSFNGFVDPNVQFRSLFDAAETDVGFSPQDFLSYNDENSRSENSKGSQTKAYPSYTYTGRQEDDQDEFQPSFNFQESQPKKYRSNFRQVGTPSSSNGDRSDNPFDSSYYDDYQNNPQRDPYQNPSTYSNDRRNRNYYRNRNDGRSSYSDPPNQEAADYSDEEDAPSKRKGNSGKSRCKKVQKEVDDEEEYNDYAPEPDYDPATYETRYKRQAGRGGGKRKRNKRPMTCYVCEDENGHYAERCSYDSNSSKDPNKGSYFHSSSTSFTDKGRPRGRRQDRSKREPSGHSNPVANSPNAPSDIDLPKRIYKRQSRGNRYASDFQGNRRDSPRKNGERYHGNSNRRPEEKERDGGSHLEYIPSVSLDVGRQGVYDGRAGANHGGPEFEFGPPHHFNGNNDDERGRTHNSPEFEFDFSIPKEFRDAIGLSDTSNTENRPVYSGPEDQRDEFDIIGYDDYVKQHFPETFGSTRSPPPPSRSETQGPRSGSAPRSTDAPSYHYRGPPSPASYREYDEPDDDRGDRSYSPPGPRREHTSSSYNYSPPPYYREDEIGPEKLSQAINQFSKKDRKNCKKMRRGDMTCYVCRDSRGINKEECMFASNPNDPQSGQMAYHEVSEYSSDPPAHNTPQHGAYGHSHHGHESKIVEKVKDAPVDYDFDY